MASREFMPSDIYSTDANKNLNNGKNGDTFSMLYPYGNPTAGIAATAIPPDLTKTEISDDVEDIPSSTT